MNTMIKIALFDENRYFSAGWQEALALHFSTYGKRTLLLDAQQVHEADLVFCYFPPGVQSCFCHFFEAQPAGRKTLYFSLRTSEGRYKRIVGTRCSLEAGVIYHDMPLVSALYQLNSGVELQDEKSITNPIDLCRNFVCKCDFSEYKFTHREIEVIHLMMSLKRGCQIAHILNINEKTVSNYKVSIMRKLGVSKSVDLYRWILCCKYLWVGG